MYNNNIIFSVAVITYNSENYIRETLDSILNQKHDYAYEIVIGDDCSTDTTRTILENYKQNYPNIIKLIFNTENLGINKNYNNVVLNCNGKYIMQCDGDDYWLPNKVSEQIPLIQNDTTLSFVYSKSMCINEKKIRIDDWLPRKNITFTDLLYYNDIPPLTVCYRKSLYQEYYNTIQPQTKQWLTQDYSLWLFLLNKGKSKYIDKYLTVYRNLSSSQSHAYSNIDKRIKFINSAIEIKLFFANFFNVTVNDNMIFIHKANEYKDLLLHSNQYNKTIAKEFLRNYKPICSNKLKYLIYTIIFLSPQLFKFCKKIKGYEI